MRRITFPTIDYSGIFSGSSCLKLLIPPNSIIHNDTTQNLPQPPFHFTWIPVFFPKANEKLLHLQILPKGKIVLNNQTITNQEKLHQTIMAQLKETVMDRIPIYIWLDVSDEAICRDFINTIATVKAAYKDYWDGLSWLHYQENYTSLLPKNRKVIRQHAPLHWIGFSTREHECFHKLQQQGRLINYLKKNKYLL